MYVRFITPEWVPYARSRRGFFAAAYSAARYHKTPEWLSEELWQEIFWFEKNLDVPKTLSKRTGRGDRDGVCWFRDVAATHVSRARYVCWLLSEIGTPTQELRSTRPGTLLWCDDHQVVALAERDARHRVRH